MGDIFKNKFFIILLIVICILTLSTIILNLSGHGSVVTDIVNLILTPFQRFAVIIKESFSGFIGYFTEFNNMKEEIAELRDQLESAESQIQDAWKLQEENDMLYSFFELKKKHPNYKFQNAKITAQDSGNYLSGLNIDKGALHNLEKDMPVIASKKIDKDKYIYIIVGYVSEVGIMTSKAVPFIRTGTSMGAYIERTGETGIVEGEFELEKNGICRLAYLSKETVIEVGDKIFSSGNGNIYPEDLYIGEIIEVIADPLSHTLTGYIQPAVDFDELKDVMVVLEFERSFY
ncbi:MAG: rod shape-determining protein MreC [Oscillospiraceae bacterium]|nr:rod shape-determining protein MreC [Oscillospiraceae bacterium]